MKRVILLLSIVVMIFGLCACGEKNTPTTEPVVDETIATETTIDENETNTDEIETEVIEETIYQFGDSITSPSGMFVFTPEFHGFANALANWPDNGYLTPYGKGVDESNNPYVADDGKVMMYFSAMLEYVGDSKKNENFSFTCKLDYDNGYIFNGPSGEGYSSDEEDWEYTTDTTFEALSSDKTRYVRFCLEVPEALETDVDKKAVLEINIEDESYLFDVDLKAAAEAKAEREAAAEAERVWKMTQVDEALTKEISSQLQGSWEWSKYEVAGKTMYKISHNLTFDGDNVKIETNETLMNTTLSNQGTYYVANAYIVLNFQDGAQACMPYTYENGEISMSQEFEGYFYKS